MLQRRSAFEALHWLCVKWEAAAAPVLVWWRRQQALGCTAGRWVLHVRYIGRMSPNSSGRVKTVLAACNTLASLVLVLLSLVLASTAASSCAGTCSHYQRCSWKRIAGNLAVKSCKTPPHLLDTDMVDASEEPTGSLDDDASSSDGASSVDYISEASDAESTASEAAAAALEDVIDAVERRVDRQRRRAALRRFVRRVRRTTVRAALFSILCLAATGAAVALERERGRWLTKCPAHGPCAELVFGLLCWPAQRRLQVLPRESIGKPSRLGQSLYSAASCHNGPERGGNRLARRRRLVVRRRIIGGLHLRGE